MSGIVSAMKKSRLLGCHVSAAGGLHKSIENADVLGVNTIQIHACPPQQWNRSPFPEGVEERFLEAKKKSVVERVFFHAIYLINLANPDPDKFELSVNSLTYALNLMGRISGDGVIVHVGSNKDQPDAEEGLKRAAFGVNSVLENSPDNSMLLLEVAAGSGKVIGDRFEDLAYIYELVENKDRVGFALDTQHMWASGYDLREDLDGVVKQIQKNFGFRKVKAIHLNDSKTELGSRKDRHENLGAGLIGKKALKAFVNHKSFKRIPFILETPALKTLETAKPEVQKLIQLAEA
jgi:deoxyribonuclease-4